MKKETTVTIPAPQIQTTKVKIVGDTPLIFNKWSEKAKRQIIDKQMKKAKAAREPRNPKAEYLASFYTDQDGYVAFPALAIKQAIVGAARNLDDVRMTVIKQNIFVKGDGDGMIKILADGKSTKPGGKGCEMREDMVRLQGMGNPADIRFRGQIRNWSAEFEIKWNAGKFSVEQVLNLLQHAGFGCGIGEWRPERGGESGTFSIKN